MYERDEEIFDEAQMVENTSTASITREAPALTVTGASKYFGGVAAVHHVDLTLEPGERRALIGPNGAGKTTLFNLITGELPSDSGKVMLFGTDVTLLSVQRRKGLGLCRTYQVSNLFLGLTVEENFYLAVDGSRMPKPWQPWMRDVVRRERAKEACRRVGLEGRFRSPVNQLSHGERRQLEVGLALAANPRLILLDEPCAGLSPNERKQMLDLITGLDPRVTVFIIEHDMDIALRCSDYVTVMHEGSVVAQGNPEEIRLNDLVQRIYMGKSVRDG
jgi:branched-chain amino acid transport system ATP-binding protein